MASKCEIIKFDEMVGLAPFENVINRTSLLILRKGRTEFPVDCTSWSKKERGELGYDRNLDQIMRITRRQRMVLEPIETKTKPESPWIAIERELVNSFRKICGLSSYGAHSGVDTGLNGVFWIEWISKVPAGILIKNRFDIGKSKLEMVQTVVEEENIFQLIRGQDVKRWQSKPSGYILLPHNKKDGRPLSENQIKIELPKTYSYFTKYKPMLENRSTHKLMGADSPFYSAYKIGKYTFAPYKVVWKEISGKIPGKGQFIVAVVRPSYSDEKITPIIPDHKLIFIPLENEEEAYFVCGILSCSAVRRVVAGFTIETEIPTNIPRYIRIPKFVASDLLHTGLANLCKKAHTLKKASEEHELEQIQTELDRLAGKVYNLSNSETQLFRESLERLYD